MLRAARVLKSESGSGGCASCRDWREGIEIGVGADGNVKMFQRWSTAWRGS